MYKERKREEGTEGRGGERERARERYCAVGAAAVPYCRRLQIKYPISLFGTGEIPPALLLADPACSLACSANLSRSLGFARRLATLTRASDFARLSFSALGPRTLANATNNYRWYRGRSYARPIPCTPASHELQSDPRTVL